MTTSSFLSYAGPFNFDFRKRMVYEDWTNSVADRKIPKSINFRLEDLLTNDV